MGRKKFLVSFRFKRLINLITPSGKQVTWFSITPYYGLESKKIRMNNLVIYERVCPI